jgi:ABC-2 type transport system ATP-binding protein
MTIAIQAKSLAKSFGTTKALDGIDLEAEEGTVLGLLGPNGSGKTTLLRMLTGYHPPSEGRLTVDGFDVVREPMEARRRIGYVPESLPLYGHMRVQELLRFMARVRGMPREAVAAAVEAAARTLELREVLSAPIHTLSRGYRQRVAIAQALVHSPGVLVLDEPTNGLDPRQIIEVRRLIRGLAGRCTVIVSSHILSEIARTADRVAILLRGALLTARPISEIPDLEQLFLSLV